MQKQSEKMEKLVSLIFGMQRIIRQSGREYQSFDPHLMLRIAVLKFIEEKENSTMKDIASYLNITAPSATSLLKNLALSGLVSREKNNIDKRVTRIFITKKGQSLIKDMMKRMTFKISDAFSKMNEAEIDDLIRILERLKEVN